MERQSRPRSGSSAGFSTYSASRSSLKEIDDDREMTDGSRLKNEGGGENEEDKIHVAVGRDFKLGKENLVWVIKNTPKTKKIVIVHVNVPAKLIPLMGAWIPAQQLREQEVYAFRLSEKGKMEKALNKYVQRCSALKEVQAEKLVIEADDVGPGLVQFIAQHKITNLVMGAAADKNYSRKMREPRSKKALIVQKQADPSCKLWFVCKGNLICIREASPFADSNVLTSRVILSATTQPSGNSNPTTSPTHGHLNFIPDSSQEELSQPSVSTIPGSPMMDLPCDSHTESSSGSRDGIVIDLFDGVSRSFRSSVSDEIPCTSSLISIAKDQKNAGSFVLTSSHGSEAPLQFSTSNSNMDGATLNDELYKDLRHAVVEANNLTHAAKEEALRHQKAVRKNDKSQSVSWTQSLGVVGPVPRKCPTDHQGKSGSAYGGQSRCPASFDYVPHLEENSCKYAVAGDRTAGP